VCDALGVTREQRVHALSLLNARRAIPAVKMMGGRGTVQPPLIGDVIRALRWRRGWSVAELARAVQVSERTVRAWERSENLPTDGILHQLCLVLNATPAEVDALTCRRVFLLSPTEPSAEISEEKLREALVNAQVCLWRGETEGMDLQFLVLESQAWRLLHRHKRGGYWWGAVQITHCQWLLHQWRVKEAAQRAYAVWHEVRREPAHNRGAAWLIQAIARDAMRNREGEIVKPLQGAQILHDWRCLIHPWKEMDAWFLRSIAECLSFAQHHDEAVETSLSALHLAQQSELPVEIHLTQHATAYVLLRANRPEESLAYLSVFPHQHPVNQVEDALLWHQILLALGERADSLTWLERARQLVEQHHLIRYQTKLAQLEQAF
jgi:transcriptional regulator with XRE-family HTH domain